MEAHSSVVHDVWIAVLNVTEQISISTDAGTSSLQYTTDSVVFGCLTVNVSQVSLLTEERDTLAQDKDELKISSKHLQQQLTLKEDLSKALQNSQSILQDDLEQVLFLSKTAHMCGHAEEKLLHKRRRQSRNTPVIAQVKRILD